MAEELRPLQRNKLYQPEMLTCAKVYCDWIMEKALGYTNPPAIMTEQQVDFSDVVPDGFGTCDCVMIGDDTLNIFDYKHGKGVRVDAVGNPQMRLYALGALARYRPLYGDTIKKVRMTIIQPRISADPSEDEMTVDTTANTSPVQDFWKNLAALLKVKTIITLVIIAVLAVLSINGSIEPDKFLTIATMVVAFYFGTQSEKKP